MSARTAHWLLKGFTAICGLHGIGGLLVVFGVFFLYLVYLVTGFEVLPRRSHESATVSGSLWVLGMSLFWLFEVLTFWLVWFRLSKLAIRVAVGLFVFWVVCIIDIITFEVMRIGGATVHVAVDLVVLAIICWPGIMLARWMSRSLIRYETYSDA